MKSIILLSGGLDALTCLAMTREKYNCELALTFDYGQKACKMEIEASKKICEYYKVEHKVIKLDFLKEITHTSLVSDDDLNEDYIIPYAFDKRIGKTVSDAVIEAARKSGSARI